MLVETSYVIGSNVWSLGLNSGWESGMLDPRPAHLVTPLCSNVLSLKLFSLGEKSKDGGERQKIKNVCAFNFLYQTHHLKMVDIKI